MDDSMTGTITALSTTVGSDPVESPCLQQCKLLDGLCGGCGRTLMEIVEWPNMTMRERQDVLARLEVSTNKSVELPQTGERHDSC